MYGSTSELNVEQTTAHHASQMAKQIVDQQQASKSCLVAGS
jgi:hypothetical protein